MRLMSIWIADRLAEAIELARFWHSRVDGWLRR